MCVFGVVGVWVLGVIWVRFWCGFGSVFHVGKGGGGGREREEGTLDLPEVRVRSWKAHPLTVSVTCVTVGCVMGGRFGCALWAYGVAYSAPH